MRNVTNKQAVAPVATVVAAPTVVAAQATVTVVQPTLRAQRVLAVKQALWVQRNNAKLATHASNLHNAQLIAYHASVAALQATLPKHLLAQLTASQQITANNAHVVALTNYNAVKALKPGIATNIRATPLNTSVAPGACKHVHQLAAQYGYVRSATLAACAAAGIAQATAATQFNIARKQNLAALAALAAQQA